MTLQPNEGLSSKHVVYYGHHKPTGEDWLILGIDRDGDRVCAAGWPPTIAKLSDCENVMIARPMTVQELRHREMQFGNNWDDAITSSELTLKETI